MFSFGQKRPRRRPNLTPMIDVVFLLLVFFMLASRFGAQLTLPLALGGSAGSAWSGPPRLVDVTPSGLALNGAVIGADALAEALAALVASPDDAIVLRARDGASLQTVIAVMDGLRAAGFSRMVLVE